MSARPTRVVSVGLLTCGLVLTGCSRGPAGDPTTASHGATASSATPSTPPAGASETSGTASATAGGDEVRGRSGAFTVVPPEGWTEATGKANGVADLDLVLLSSKKVGAFANNLVVLSSTGDRSVLEEQLAQSREQMSAAGRTLSAAPTRSVAGVPAVGVATTFQREGVTVLARSYWVQRDGRIFLLTLSCSQGDAAHALAELDELLSTWTWT